MMLLAARLKILAFIPLMWQSGNTNRGTRTFSGVCVLCFYTWASSASLCSLWKTRNSSCWSNWGNAVTTVKTEQNPSLHVAKQIQDRMSNVACSNCGFRFPVISQNPDTKTFVVVLRRVIQIIFYWIHLLNLNLSESNHQIFLLSIIKPF